METKKQLKDFINKKGFYFHVVDVDRLSSTELNQILGVEKNGIKTSVERPAEADNIVFFRGVATQQFGIGETNRNGYKIDVAGWDWTNYLKNPQILLSHDPDQPIGKCLEIIPKKDRIDILYYVDLGSLNSQDAHRVRTNLFAGLSTGSLTMEYMYEDCATGERFSEEDLMHMPWAEMSQRRFDRVVTKAEAVEISKVSLPSNPDALTMEDGLKRFFDQKEEETKLFDENRVRTAKLEKNDITENKSDEEEKPAVPTAPIESTPPTPAEVAGKPEEQAPVDEEEEGDENEDDEESIEGEENNADDGKEEEGDEPSDSDDDSKGSDSEESPENAGEGPATAEPAAENAEGEESEDDKGEGADEDKQPEGAADEGEKPKLEGNAVIAVDPNKVDSMDLNAAISAAPKVLQDLIVELSQNLITAQRQIDSIPQRKGRLLTDQFQNLKDDAKSPAKQLRTNGAWATGLARKVGKIK